MDAYLAAFAMRARLAFATFDDGFARFQPRGLELILLPEHPGKGTVVG